MKKFIALMAAAVFVITAVPAKPAFAGNNGAAIAAFAFGAMVGAMASQHHGYGTPVYRPYYRPQPQYVAPNVHAWGQRFYGQPPCFCDHYTTYGIVRTPGPCPTFRATGGVVIQRWGRPY